MVYLKLVLILDGEFTVWDLDVRFMVFVMESYIAFLRAEMLLTLPSVGVKVV